MSERTQKRAEKGLSKEWGVWWESGKSWAPSVSALTTEQGCTHWDTWLCRLAPMRSTKTHICIHISIISNACVCSDVTWRHRETHRHSCYCPFSLVNWNFILPTHLMSALTTSSFLCAHLLLSFLSFMHAILCQLENIISTQTGRESAGTPPACKFIWFAHWRRSINLLRRETGVLVAYPRADRSIACLLTRFLCGCSCWKDLTSWRAWCFAKVRWRPRLELFLSVISLTPFNPV